MRRDDDDRPERAIDEADDRLAALGPPGWDEYVAARRRFATTLALQGLERALGESGRGPLRGSGAAAPG